MEPSRSILSSKSAFPGPKTLPPPSLIRTTSFAALTLLRPRFTTLPAIDQARRHRGAEAVVDVHDGHPGGARVEHGQQRRQPTEAGAVADAGGNGDHRLVDEARHHARQ